MSKSKKSERTRTIKPWEPFAELQPILPWGRSFGPRVERLLERLSDEMGEERHPFPSLLAPAVDLDENETHYTLTAEIPGVDKDDITIELTDGALTLRGEKTSEREEKSDRRRYTERRYGAFTRSLPLPRDAESDPARIEASYDNGVLTVKIPRSEEAKPSVIAIQ